MRTNKVFFSLLIISVSSIKRVMASLYQKRYNFKTPKSNTILKVASYIFLINWLDIFCKVRLRHFYLFYSNKSYYKEYFGFNPILKGMKSFPTWAFPIWAFLRMACRGYNLPLEHGGASSRLYHILKNGIPKRNQTNWLFNWSHYLFLFLITV